MTALRHGFRARAERLAVELRAELDLGPSDRIDPRVLADLYGIPVVAASSLPVDAEHASYFARHESGAWSAATIFHGTRRLIVLNDGHDFRRLTNSLSHELAHVFLEHDPAPVVNPDGSRSWNPTAEAEADELGAQILLPGRTARELAIRGWTARQAAERFGVSEPLAKWRLNISGGTQIRMRARANH